MKYNKINMYYIPACGVAVRRNLMLLESRVSQQEFGAADVRVGKNVSMALVRNKK